MTYTYYKDSKISLPCNILRLMKVYGYTFEDLSKSINTTGYTVRKWRRSWDKKDSIPNDEEFKQIEAVYGWKKEQLLDDQYSDFVDVFDIDVFTDMFLSGYILKEKRYNAVPVSKSIVDITSSFVIKNSNSILYPYSELDDVYFVFTDIRFIDTPNQWNVEFIFDKRQKKFIMKFVLEGNETISIGDNQEDYHIYPIEEFNNYYFRYAKSIQVLIYPCMMRDGSKLEY